MRFRARLRPRLRLRFGRRRACRRGSRHRSAYFQTNAETYFERRNRFSILDFGLRIVGRRKAERNLRNLRNLWIVRSEPWRLFRLRLTDSDRRTANGEWRETSAGLPGGRHVGRGAAGFERERAGCAGCRQSTCRMRAWWCEHSTTVTCYCQDMGDTLTESVTLTPSRESPCTWAGICEA